MRLIISLCYIVMQKIVNHKFIGEVILTKRTSSKSIRISINSVGKVRVSLPNYTPFSKAEAFLEANVKGILAALEKQKHRRENTTTLSPNVRAASLSNDQLAQINKRAHELLPVMLKDISVKLNKGVTIRNRIGIKIKEPFSYNRVAIKNNKSNWGSCSTLRNINLNMHLVNLPKELIEFIIVHELCHLVYPNHGERFHKLVDNICGGREKELSRRLKAYRPGV